MQTLAILIFIIFPKCAFAQTPASTYGGYAYAATPPNPAQTCISDICGAPPQSNLFMTKYLDRFAEYLRLTSDPKQTDFPPSVAKDFSDLAAENDKGYGTGLALFRKSSNMGDAQLDGISKALYNVTYASPFLKKIKYRISAVNGKLVASVDEPASIAELKDLSPADKIWILQAAKYFVAHSFNNSVPDNQVQSQPPGLLLKMLHPGVSVDEAMKAELSEAQSSIASLKNLSPLEQAVFFNSTSPDRIALIAAHVAQNTVDENETREIIQWNRTYKSTNNLFRSPDSPFVQRTTPPVEEIIKMGGGVDAIARSFIKDRPKERQKEEDKIQSCKMQYFLNKGLLPTKDQINTLKRDIERSKQMVQEMIKTKFPSSMQEKLLKAVADADFVMPPTATDFEKSFADSVRQKLEARRLNAISLNKLPPQVMRQILSTFSFAKAAKDPNDKNDSNEFCDSFKYSPMSDGNYTTFGSIVLSFTTATGDEASRMKTVMHELGHSVSKAIEDDQQYSQQLSSVRSCLKDQHTEELPPQAKKSYENAKAVDSKASGPYTEEDFADAVAGNSGRDVNGRNAWCQFMSLTPDRQQYQESKLQSDDGDPHSASLFRLFNFEMMKKGNLPDSCKSFLKAAQFTEHFRSCFDLANPKGTTPTEPARAVR